jgi:ubiquinone/menaquinone biosynthesis C-methylase UbiE
VLHYYRNPSPLVEEAARVLKPTGYIVVIEYDQSTSTPWDPYPLSPAVIEALFKDADLEPVKTLTVDRKYRPKHVVVGTKPLF